MDEIASAAEVQQNEKETAGTQTQGTVWYEGPMDLAFIRSAISAGFLTIKRSFVAIGFYLKKTEEEKIFLEGGYSSIWDFAYQEYGLDKSATSRCMGVCRRFSVDGNSPILQEKYRDFNKSQLQEMLSLTDEQLEQVTPEMKVRQIREMKPKETPYYPMEGQLEFEQDFPEIMPEPAGELPAGPQTFEMSVEDMLSDEAEEEEPVATSQQPEKTDLCLHRPSFHCTLEEADKHTPGNGEDCAHKCCWDCSEHGSCNIECYASASRPDPGAAKTQQESEEALLESQRKTEVDREQSDKSKKTEWYIGEERENRQRYCEAIARKLISIYHDWMLEDFANRVTDVIRSENEFKKHFRKNEVTWYFKDPENGVAHVNLFDDYIQFWNGSGECVGNCEWFYLCAAVQNMWNTITLEKCRKEETVTELVKCESESGDNVIEAEFTELPDNEECTPQYFLREEQGKLNEILEAFKGEAPENVPRKMIERQKIVVAALAAMVCDLEEAELQEQMQWPRAEQPELPVMRNNDQRKAFLETFHDWPVWFRVPEAAEVYYRYDLPDKTALVICEYRFWRSWVVDYGYKDQDPDTTETQEFLLTPGYHYLKDCEANRTMMIEKLKEIQKR